MRGFMLAAMIVLSATPVMAQGLMSGTGMGPSQQVATPPDSPAIDRPGVQPAAPVQVAPAHPAHPHPMIGGKPTGHRGTSPTTAAQPPR